SVNEHIIIGSQIALRPPSKISNRSTQGIDKDKTKEKEKEKEKSSKMKNKDGNDDELQKKKKKMDKNKKEKGKDQKNKEKAKGKNKDKGKKDKKKKQNKEKKKQKKQTKEKEVNQFDDMNEEQLGYIRDEIDDEEWTIKLNKEEENLQAHHDKIPSPIVSKNFINMIITSFVIVALSIVQLIIVVVFIGSYQEKPMNIVLSGMRPATLAQIQYLLLRAIMNYQCVSSLRHINLPATSQPMWKDDSHVSTDRKVILTLAERTSLYFNQLHMSVHYGSSQYTHFSDTTIDGIVSKRLSQSQNSQLLFHEEDCFLTSISCDEASPTRIYEQSPPFY
ncbi:MAG: hypothetical protein EZS28_049971, partial [Streblomastix strix]